MRFSTGCFLVWFLVAGVTSSVYAQDKNICDLVDKAYVEAMLGAPLPGTQSRIGAQGVVVYNECTYTDVVQGQPYPRNPISVTISRVVTEAADPAAVDQQLKRIDEKTYDDGIPVPDLGDAALWVASPSSRAGTLVVFSGGKTTLQIGGIVTRDQARTLALKALGSSAGKTGFVYGTRLPLAKPALARLPAKPSQIEQLKFDLTAKAETGNAKAQFALGNFYEFGMIGPEGIPKPDYSAAAYWYQEASDRGELPASFALAKLLRGGLGMPSNPTAGLYLLRKAAVSGYVPAMVPLSYAYGELNGSPKTRTDTSGHRAQRWSGAAAEAGDPAGQLIVGYLYHQGLNLPPGAVKSAGYKDAMVWYQKAAAGGDCVALMNIGGMYFNGDGVPQDKNQAQSWFAKAEACSGGNLEWMRDKAVRYRERAAAGRLPAVQAGPVPAGNAGTVDVERFAKNVLAMLATSLAASALNPTSSNGAALDVNYDDLLRQMRSIRQSACLQAGLAFANSCQ